ncbi:MAG: ATP-binding protein [Deltaproteobacteria bacterium]|nr:ATP-binding protein [Deltaproteobacteria bacterium]
MLALKEILELDEEARIEAQKYPKKRELFQKIAQVRGKHFIGIAGPRGVGKTVLLKQFRRRSKNAVYISLDAIEEVNLFELVKMLSESYDLSLFLIDEIHFVRNYAQSLKKIYDFLDVRIIFTSSVSLSLLESAYDLSRRVRILKLYPFSYREYLYFKKDVRLPRLTIQDIIDRNWRLEHLRHGYAFEDYIKGGILPFSLEEPNVLPLLENVIKKIIRRDIPNSVPLNLDELPLIERLLRFVGKSSIDGINYSSLSKNLGITKYKAESYVDAMEKAFVLNVILPRGANVSKEPKILMYLPLRLLYEEYEFAIGGLREDFFAEMMVMKNLEFHYLKSTRGAKTPDFLVNLDGSELIVEIGGKGKGRQQFKGISMEKSLILSQHAEAKGIKRPLFLLGYL